METDELTQSSTIAADQSLSACCFVDMAFRSRTSLLFRSSLSAFRTVAARRTFTSRFKESGSYFKFAGPVLIGASAATAGLFAANQLYRNNFTLIGNVHAATKVGIVNVTVIYSRSIILCALSPLT